MARDVPTDEKEDLLRAMEEANDALSVTEILARLTIEVPRRTLQDRLKTLYEEGVVTRTGRVRSTKYQLTENMEDDLAHVAPLPLSHEGRKALAYVSQNLAQRQTYTPAPSC